MGGRLWSDAEEKFFWRQVVSRSGRRAAVDADNEVLSWGELAAMMQVHMDHLGEARRAYSAPILFEHFFKNYESNRISRHAEVYLREYLDKLGPNRTEFANPEARRRGIMAVRSKIRRAARRRRRAHVRAVAASVAPIPGSESDVDTNTTNSSGSTGLLPEAAPSGEAQGPLVWQGYSANNFPNLPGITHRPHATQKLQVNANAHAAAAYAAATADAAATRGRRLLVSSHNIERDVTSEMPTFSDGLPPAAHATDEYSGGRSEGGSVRDRTTTNSRALEMSGTYLPPLRQPQGTPAYTAFAPNNLSDYPDASGRTMQYECPPTPILRPSHPAPIGRQAPPTPIGGEPQYLFPADQMSGPTDRAYGLGDDLTGAFAAPRYTSAIRSTLEPEYDSPHRMARGALSSRALQPMQTIREEASTMARPQPPARSRGTSGTSKKGGRVSKKTRGANPRARGRPPVFQSPSTWEATLPDRTRFPQRVPPAPTDEHHGDTTEDEDYAPSGPRRRGRKPLSDDEETDDGNLAQLLAGSTEDTPSSYIPAPIGTPRGAGTGHAGVSRQTDGARPGSPRISINVVGRWAPKSS
ncbi:hypothetical protein F5Y04DRAFT_284383 [Hypomontagnella monticulosa]|nr:hypothetical protein F5Y04DRAFT_284383 [Hypomontagnella monticulosa]